jgi:hypothetical protein
LKSALSDQMSAQFPLACLRWRKEKRVRPLLARVLSEFPAATEPADYRGFPGKFERSRLRLNVPLHRVSRGEQIVS